MINPYVAVLAFMILIAGFLFFMLFISYSLGPKNKTRTKQIPFECGAVSVGEVKDHRFSVRFYLVAMLFILFDIEVIFMYPWALVLEQFRMTAFLQMLSFVSVLTLGLVYIWKKGVLNWND